MGIGRSSFWFSLGTIFSRISGLLRDSVVAGIFGASAAMDAFVVAFRIPNLLRDMLAEGALSSAFTKVYSSLSVTDPERAETLLLDTLVWTIALGIFVSVSGSMLSPWLVELMTLVPQQDDAASKWFHSNATAMTALLFPYLIFPMIGAVLMGAMHQHGRFFITGLSPIWLNLGFVAGALVFAPIARMILPESISQFVDAGMIGLCIGVLVGGAASLAFEVWGMWQLAIKEMKWRSFVPRFSEDVRNVLKIMVPAALAAGIGPINVTINTNFATSAGEGAVTWLNYAFRLLQMPIGVFGVAIASAALPAMTRAIAKAGNRVDDAAARELQSALELVLWLMVPCMLILICNSLPMIRLLFQHARFTSEDATATAVALSAYSYGIIGYGMAKVLTAFYFALERTKFALIVGVISIMVNLVGNSILVERFGHVGLAMTSSVSLSINALVLLIGLSHSQIQWNRLNLLKTFGFLAVGGALSYYLQESILEALSNSNWLHHYNYKIESLIQIALNGLFVCTVFAMLAMFRLKIGPTTLWRIIKSRGRRK